jgi:hypothetical protein
VTTVDLGGGFHHCHKQHACLNEYPIKNPSHGKKAFICNKELISPCMENQLFLMVVLSD